MPGGDEGRVAPQGLTDSITGTLMHHALARSEAGRIVITGWTVPAGGSGIGHGWPAGGAGGPTGQGVPGDDDLQADVGLGGDDLRDGLEAPRSDEGIMCLVVPQECVRRPTPEGGVVTGT
ncbi:hypothetical protein BJF80_06370 [Serinicoccus sp. CUA-874]|nr:hypothetical protein BJF80_06370 [Serinicoccus sp. CUA-874]